MGLKQCSGPCGELLPLLISFYAHGSWCKSCYRDYYQSNRAKRLAYQKRYDAEHRTKQKAPPNEG